jgi:hypothetical protein
MVWKLLLLRGDQACGFSTTHDIRQPKGNRLMADKDLVLVGDRCSAYLNQIAKNFKTGAKLTLIVRTPGNDEADFVLTIDDLDEAIKVLERRRDSPLLTTLSNERELT